MGRITLFTMLLVMTAITLNGGRNCFAVLPDPTIYDNENKLRDEEKHSRFAPLVVKLRELRKKELEFIATMKNNTAHGETQQEGYRLHAEENLKYIDHLIREFDPYEENEKK